MEEDKIVKIEEEIAKDLKDKVKNVYAKDSQKIIETEVRNRKYLAEDWPGCSSHSKIDCLSLLKTIRS